jgi:hypothetical protein
MKGWDSLRRFVSVDDSDAGCSQTFVVMDLYAEHVLLGDAERRYPEVASHLRVCGPCAEDLRGLLALMSGPL